jgi:hypothetical protein
MDSVFRAGRVIQHFVAGQGETARELPDGEFRVSVTGLPGAGLPVVVANE